jgi:hypothetical protein
LDGAAPAVECTVPFAQLEAVDDPDGETMEVGTILTQSTLALSEGYVTAWPQALARLDVRHLVPIVDERLVLVGVVDDAGIRSRATCPSRPPSPDAPPRSRGPGTGNSAIAMHERTPIRVALRLLAAAHLREAIVVSKDGVPLGVFRDVDGLRWIASARAT